MQTICIDRCKDLYLDLLKRSLIGQISEDGSRWIEGIGQEAQLAAHIAPIRAVGAAAGQSAPMARIGAMCAASCACCPIP